MFTYEIKKYYAAGAIAAGASSLIDTAANVWMQSAANKGSHDLTTQMYAQQRKDALSDWNMQNAYNSPGAQMERYRKAGLNPNLIYGQSNTAPPVRSSTPGSWNPQAPRLDTAVAVEKYFNVQQQQATIDNIKAQGDLIRKQTDLAQAQADATYASTGKTKVDTSRAEFDLTLAQALRSNDIQLAQQTLRNAEISGFTALRANERAAAINQQDLQKGLLAIIGMRIDNLNKGLQNEQTRQQIENLKLAAAGIKIDNSIKGLDQSLKERGYSWSDPWYVRVAGTVLDKSLDTAEKKPMIQSGLERIQDMGKKGVDWFKDKLDFSPRVNHWDSGYNNPPPVDWNKHK